MTFTLADALAALPWLAAPAVVLWRAADSWDLGELPAEPPDDAPRVSIVIPARDEAANIGACVRSVLASNYPDFELIVVDDHSRDGTAELARQAGAGDPRLRVLASPDLPEGWFGKQWACETGARAATGAWLCFSDADTRHAPELLSRALRARALRRADLLSVAGSQELRGFWERVVQPAVFILLATRTGGSERMNRSRRLRDKLANGQFMLARRDAYERVGGHAAVRATVGEDMALAREFHRHGFEVVVATGMAQLTTRMYASLGDIVAGWGKNLYAAGRDAMPGGRLGQAAFPLALMLLPLFQLAPVAGLAAAWAGLAPGLLAWALLAIAPLLVAWAAIYAYLRLSPLYALGFPLGSLVLLWIVVRAVARGQRVEWKGRRYVSARMR